MQRRAALLTIALLALSCGQAPPSGSFRSPSASAATAATASASPSQSSGGTLTGSYGLILSAGTLDLVRPDGTIGASASVAAPSVQFCSSAHDGAVLQPPVSASNNQVYFRDGDTKIRMVVAPSGATDVTSVPGGPTTISFFSVSPDDQRIAVLVEDLSSANTIKLRLYVEDLHGGGNHKDIYTPTPQVKGKLATTLWPMGWHQGELVLAIVPACSFEPAGLTPSEWHVSNPVTANRIATIRSTNCILSYWPSPAGVACVNPQTSTTLYDWAGKVVSVVGGPTQVPYSQTGLSPAGTSIFFATGAYVGAPSPRTQIVQLTGPYATVQGHSACSWIDEDHVLAPDAVIQFPAETPGNVQVNATVTPLAASGQCAGRFPGGL